MFCKYCGTTCSDDSRFCSSCGRSLRIDEVARYRDFSIFDAVSYGWNILKNNFIPSFLITSLFLIIPFIRYKFQIALIGFILNTVIYYLIIRIMLAVTAGSYKFDNALFVSNKSSLLQYFAGSVLYYLIIMAGFILLVLPGIYLSIRLCLWDYHLVENNSNAVDALGWSWKATKGWEFKLALWWLTGKIILLLGFAFILIGYIIAVPLVVYSEYYIYRKIGAKNGL